MLYSYNNFQKGLKMIENKRYGKWAEAAGYIQFGHDTRDTRQELVTLLLESGYDNVSPKETVAGAILDGDVQQKLHIPSKRIDHILLVDENDFVGIARLVWDVDSQLKPDEVMLKGSFVGGDFQDAEYLVMYVDED
jgi:hypothetical protein